MPLFVVFYCMFPRVVQLLIVQCSIAVVGVTAHHFIDHSKFCKISVRPLLKCFLQQRGDIITYEFIFHVLNFDDWAPVEHTLIGFCTAVLTVQELRFFQVGHGFCRVAALIAVKIWRLIHSSANARNGSILSFRKSRIALNRPIIPSWTMSS